MVLNITYCSKDKTSDPGKIPAIERYVSGRIEDIKSLSDSRNEDFAILSGKYGLIKPSRRIPEYDKLLREEDIEEVIPKVANFLDRESVGKVVYHTRKVEGKRVPYYLLIKKACERQGIEMEKNLI